MICVCMSRLESDGASGFEPRTSESLTKQLKYCAGAVTSCTSFPRSVADRQSEQVLTRL
jgi:hypothetical protein